MSPGAQLRALAARVVWQVLDQRQSLKTVLASARSDIVDPRDRAHLERQLADTDLIRLRHQIADIQGNLIDLARRRGIVQQRGKTNAAYLSRRKITPTQRASSDESTNPTKRAS